RATRRRERWPPASPPAPVRWRPSWHHPNEAAAEHRDQLGGAIDVVVAHRQKVDPRRRLGVRGDHGAPRVRARVAARAVGVGDADPARDVDALLADPFVALAFAAQPDDELLALHLAEVVQPDGNLELD